MFCRAPFVGLSVHPVKICCCCMNVENISIEQHRIDMYNNKINDVCKNCDLRKDFDASIYDEVFKKNLNNFDITTGKIKNYYPGWLHIIYSYKCNCGCKICGTWMYDHKDKLSLNYIKQYINLDSIKFISLQGGEIFLFEKELEPLFKIINELNVPVHIITNGTIINENILNLLKKIKNLIISISIDGYGKLEKYMRPNSSYDYVLDNIKKIKKITKNINVNYTVSIFNVYETIENLIKIKNDLPDSKININMVVQPHCFSIISLPDEIKLDLLKKFDVNYMIKYNDFSNLNHLLNFKKIYKDKDILKIIIKFLKKNNYKFDKNELYYFVSNNDTKYNLDIDVLNLNIKKYILSCEKAT